MSTYATKSAAEAAAKRVLAKMNGKGWKAEVHKNLGWHFKLRLGPIQLYQTDGNVEKYFCLIGTDRTGSGGLALWAEDSRSEAKYSTDPNKCVRRAIKFARSTIDAYSAVLKISEDALAASLLKF